MRATDLMIDAGISYRQLDHWVRRGWVRPRHAGGTGSDRDFVGDEIQVTMLMGSLVNRVGIDPERAARYARGMLTNDGIVRVDRFMLMLMPALTPSKTPG